RCQSGGRAQQKDYAPAAVIPRSASGVRSGIRALALRFRSAPSTLRVKDSYERSLPLHHGLKDRRVRSMGLQGRSREIEVVRDKGVELGQVLIEIEDLVDSRGQIAGG